MDVRNFFDWFTGGGTYHTLYHCMAQDKVWVAITVTLDLAVACGYILIAKHWWKNERHLPPIPAKKALTHMRNIFVFCGICGYLFIPIKMFWPAWRMYDIVMLALVYFTWRYAWNAGNLKVIYAELGRNAELAEELRRSQEESRRKSTFLNAISHDLRTPLNALFLQADLVEMSAAKGESDTVVAAIREIRASARVTADLLDNFLESARLDCSSEPNRLGPVDVNAMVQRTTTSFEAAAMDKGLYLKTSSPTGLDFETDRVKVERILSNLVSNAIKFTASGGVRLEVERSPAAIQFHVIDTGIGIEPTDQGRLFDDFYQVANGERDRSKGFGLGLSIARRLARQLGGEVQLDSSLGKGSRFSLVLPLVLSSNGRQVTMPHRTPVNGMAVAT